jgi:hypothetical protein
VAFFVSGEALWIEYNELKSRYVAVWSEDKEKVTVEAVKGRTMGSRFNS